MGKRKTLNERRLTKTQVAEYLAKGARPRPDLEEALAETYRSGITCKPKIYELEGGRILRVFDETECGLAGRGDIFPADYFDRFVRWVHRVREHAAAGRNSSVSHWFYYSNLRTSLPAHVPDLLRELSRAVRGASSTLELSYAGLDSASRYIDVTGVERVQEEIYDHLVAYVGEVIRLRTNGVWRIEERNGPEAYPYIAAARHACIMPVNVVWSQLSGLDAADLRHEAANEVRRARAKDGVFSGTA